MTTTGTARTPQDAARAEALVSFAIAYEYPPCCLAETMRRTADTIWDIAPERADSYELLAVTTLEKNALPYERGHDIDRCPKRTTPTTHLGEKP